MFYLKMHMNFVCVCTCICVHSLQGQNKEFCSVLTNESLQLPQVQSWSSYISVSTTCNTSVKVLLNTNLAILNYNLYTKK